MDFIKYRQRIIAVIVIVALAVCILPWRRSIDTTVTGVQGRIGDAAYTENIAVSVKGVYNQYLLRNDSFKGTIEVGDYTYTSDGSSLSLTFTDGYALLIYHNFTYGSPSQNSLGFICTEPNFSKLLICVNEPVYSDSKGWSGGDGLFISAPAQTREQALEIAKKLSSRSNWLSHTNWR